MQALTDKIIQAGWGERVLSHAQVARLLDGTPQRRYNLVNRALRHGELVQLRRGLYVLARQAQLVHPFVLAQALQSGSYVSFESALSFHGWIPEAVPVTLSVLPGRRQLASDLQALGLFRFYPLALLPGQFLQGVDRHTFAGQSALVAQPLRALLDMICLRKLEADRVLELTQSMRIDADLLLQTPAPVWQALLQVYAHQRMARNIAVLETGLSELTRPAR
ncbi:MAG: hypothetical protein K9K38_12985 [Rhodoferax sp.]|nr:hypothetical protein [Rhodoferax sp.]